MSYGELYEQCLLARRAGDDARAEEINRQLIAMNRQAAELARELRKYGGRIIRNSNRISGLTAEEFVPIAIVHTDGTVEDVEGRLAKLKAGQVKVVKHPHYGNVLYFGVSANQPT